MISVREIVAEDFDSVIALAKLLHAESPYFSTYTFSEDKLRETLESCLDDPESKCWVALDGGRIIGLLGGYITQEFFSTDLVACDFSLYIVPELRSTRKGVVAFLELENNFLEWARLYGIYKSTPVHVRQGIATQIKAKSFDRLMGRIGMRLAGHFYIAGAN